MGTAGWLLLLGMGWRVRRSKDPVPRGDIVVEAGVVETGRLVQRPQSMGSAGVILLSVGGENLVVGCAGVEGLLGGNAADFEGGCFLDAEAVNAVSHRSPSSQDRQSDKTTVELTLQKPSMQMHVEIETKPNRLNENERAA